MAVVSGHDIAAELIKNAFDSKFGKIENCPQKIPEDLNHPIFDMETKDVVNLIEKQTGLVRHTRRFKRGGKGNYLIA